MWLPIFEFYSVVKEIIFVIKKGQGGWVKLGRIGLNVGSHSQIILLLLEYDIF